MHFCVDLCKIYCLSTRDGLGHDLWASPKALSTYTLIQLKNAVKANKGPKRAQIGYHIIQTHSPKILHLVHIIWIWIKRKKEENKKITKYIFFLPDMLISATNLPNSSEIPLSCSLNLALKNFFCWFCSCCCCWRFSLRLPCLGSEIFFSWGCWPPITRPFEQWPLLRWPPLIPPFGKSLWKIHK